MSNIGGFFCGKPLPPKEGEDAERIVRQYAFVWGRAIKDAEDKTVKARSVTFYVKYGEEPNRLYSGQKGERRVNGKFLKCQASGTSSVAAVMAAIEKGDIVLCFGRTTRRNTRTQRGDKWLYQMKVDVIIPMGLISFLLRLYASAGIQAILDAEDNEAPDAWENGEEGL